MSDGIGQAWGAMRVDVAIVTVLPVEYGAVLGILEPGHAPFRDPGGEPNRYAWEVGLLAAGGASLRVVVALVGDAGQVPGHAGTWATIDRFRPRYTVVLGVAGAFPGRGVGLGDVVVASVIWGYEYGKVDGGFAPRGDRVWQVDGSLLRSALGFAAVGEGWAAAVGCARPGEGAGQPRVVVGPVASGDKVIDDARDPFVVSVLGKWPKLVAVEMEGAGAAAAAREMSERGHVNGLIMVRGISDVVPDGSGGAAAGGTGVRDDWKPYAAAAAAAFVRGWVGGGWWPVGAREWEGDGMVGAGVARMPRASGEAMGAAWDEGMASGVIHGEVVMAGRASARGGGAGVGADRAALRRRLAVLYRERDDVARVLGDAGFDVGRVKLDGSAEARWFNALGEVMKFKDGLDRLRAVVEKDGYTL